MAQSCACSDAVAMERSKAAAKSFSERDIERVMGRSVVRGKEAGQDEVVDFRREIYFESHKAAVTTLCEVSAEDTGDGSAFILCLWLDFICE